MTDDATTPDASDDTRRARDSGGTDDGNVDDGDSTDPANGDGTDASGPGSTAVLSELQNQVGKHWYENGFFYAVNVKTFLDADGDGVGDFPGLTNRLDYLDRLGVSCIWVLPFYPSPGRDNGYDVADYYGVDDRLGTLGDVVRFVREAHQRGIKVLTDLVVNHTSDQHPWFRRARADPDSEYRDYYVFAEDPPEPEHEPIFPSEDSVWTYDEEAEAYYYHRFYDFEPGLNHANPAVREEVCKIMDFWLELGIDGFRIDATPVLIQRKGLESTELDEPHRILKEYRAFVSRRNNEAILLGETGGEPEDVRPYFGDGTGDEMQMLFNFTLTDYLFLALAEGDGTPIREGFDDIPLPPRNGQWANFLRNLDELNLEWLSESEREAVYRRFAPEDDMRIFERGTRRRLAPMLDDRRLLEVAYSLLFSMPGTPVVPYGDEIGMGEDLSLEGRDAVRTPMQWADEANGGFSSAAPEDLVRPPISGGAFGYERVNVDDQRNDPDSLFNWMTRAVGIRREYPAFGRGRATFLETEPEAVVAHRIDDDDHDIVVVHNLADAPRRVTLAVDGDLSGIFGDGESTLADDDPPEVDLGPYGYAWYRLGEVRL